MPAERAVALWLKAGKPSPEAFSFTARILYSLLLFVLSADVLYWSRMDVWLAHGQSDHPLHCCQLGYHCYLWLSLATKLLQSPFCCDFKSEFAVETNSLKMPKEVKKQKPPFSTETESEASWVEEFPVLPNLVQLYLGTFQNSWMLISLPLLVLQVVVIRYIFFWSSA